MKSDSDRPTGAAPVTGEVRNDSQVCRPGSVIGRYRIIRKIGEGGMGIVYEAEQDFPRRRVALKVIAGGRFVRDREIQLFRREIEALARLRHPGIATLHEADQTGDGLHFFAMELVSGVPLTSYTLAANEAGALDSAELQWRLKLFVKICSAVNYAHQRGVVHRDLKPGNVIVCDPEGGKLDAELGKPLPDIKILDFGLAKIGDTDVTSLQSTAGHLLGTLSYMSPEQARAKPEDIDLRSDVYSLGVILYELVTGDLPYKLDWRSTLDAVRVIIEESPARPSVTLSGGKTRRWNLKPSVSPDLETVMLKALEKEPDHRYQSALALGEDLQRFMTGLPILARPPSAGYQFRKLISRHKPAFCSALALFTVLVALAVNNAWQSARIAAERDRANREAQAAEQVKEYLVQLFQVLDPSETRGSTVTARELLETGALRIEEELGEQPAIQATLQTTLGRVYRSLGLYQSSATMLRKALQKQERLFGAESLEVARTQDALGLVLQDSGELDAAEQMFRKALTTRKHQLGERHSEIADSLNNLAGLLHDRGAYAEAEPLYMEALTMRRALHGDEHPDVANNLHDLASLRYSQGNYELAETLFRETLALKRRIFGDDHLEVAATLANLAWLQKSLGHYEVAEQLYRDALEINRDIVGGQHPFVAIDMTNLANLLNEIGEYGRAEQLVREAIRILELEHSPDHWRLAVARSVLGASLTGLKQFAEAEPLLVETFPIIEGTKGREAFYSEEARSRIVELYRSWGKSSEAERYRTERPR